MKNEGAAKLSEKLDHVVINVKFEMDRAETAFRDLGFTLTPRGYHTLGSINHLMMFGTDYLELIGLPAGSDSMRADIADAPYGITGLVFKTEDADRTFAHVQAAGMAGDPPKSFSRPVDLPDVKGDAAFRTVTVKTGTFPGGRVYYCEHATPELVWRPEWQAHANGVVAVPEFVVASNDAADEAARFGQLLDSPVEDHGGTWRVPFDGGYVSVLTPAAYADRYGVVASDFAGRSSFFGALVFRTDRLDKIRGIVAGKDLPLIDEPNRVVLREPTFDSVLEFIE